MWPKSRLSYKGAKQVNSFRPLARLALFGVRYGPDI
jgi:hypothetical protein